MTKKRGFALALCCVGAVLVLTVGFWALYSSMRSYELHLPDFADLKSITLTQPGGEEVELVDARAEDVLFLLKGNGRTTNTESIQDAPVNVENWIKVDMNFWESGTSTLFVCHRPESRNGEYFIEQPYNGIYEISGEEYNSIQKYAEQEAAG